MDLSIPSMNNSILKNKKATKFIKLIEFAKKQLVTGYIDL